MILKFYFLSFNIQNFYIKLKKLLKEEKLGVKIMK